MENKILKDLDLCVLQVHDSNVITGGSLIDYGGAILKKLTPAAFAIWVIDNWEDVKKGIDDGWNVR
jgi:hypothetical protein